MVIPPKFEAYKKTATMYVSDVRNLGLVAFCIVVMLVSWSGIKTIQTNYELQKKISVLQQQNDVKKLENENQKLKNAYLQTDQYVELTARRQFGMAAPGETVWLIPKQVAMSYTKDLPRAGANEQQPIVTESTGQRHFQAWLDFFLHRK